MQTLLIILIPIFLFLTMLTLLISLFLFKSPLKVKRVVALPILCFGLISDGLIIYQLKRAYDESALCSLSPNCMDESGLLYVIYYGLLILSSLLVLSGLVKTIRTFIKKDKTTPIIK